MASRKLSSLTGEVRDKASQLVESVADRNVSLLVYCTYRDNEEQARLFRQGRTLAQITAKAHELRHEWQRPDLADLLMSVGPQYGRYVVTNAGPGQSLHNYHLALDAVPLRDGKPVWNREDPEDVMLWTIYGEAAESLGLDWAGHWTHFQEFPHVQQRGADWRELISVS